jgi:hypothetical protein
MIPTSWYIPIGFLAIFGAFVWHASKVEMWKADILATERQRVAFASERLQKEEQKRAADIAAESEREASQHEEAMAHRDKEIAEANAKIAEMEKGKCVVSRGTVRQLNRAQGRSSLNR